MSIHEETGYIQNALSEDRLNSVLKWHRFYELVQEHERNGKQI